jgi:hypothetical protein
MTKLYNYINEKYNLIPNPSPFKGEGPKFPLLKKERDNG